MSFSSIGIALFLSPDRGGSTWERRYKYFFKFIEDDSVAVVVAVAIARAVPAASSDEEED
jgi:hypothetical protein